MAVGQMVLIASGASNQVAIPSGNYPWPTIRILNPNDGIVYVKQNGTVTGAGWGSWDYKIPSQSYGLLPGGGEGWQSVGLFYLDQSGANRPGELTIYLTQQQATEPMFLAIGRALVTQSTTVDIVEGSQPANPGSGIGRLWIDTTDHLHILNSAGADKVVLDSSNYASIITLIGDVTGPVSNTAVTLRNVSAIWFQDSGGTYRHAIEVNGTNVLNWAVGNGAFRWVNQANTIEWMHVDGTSLVVAGGGVFGSTITSNDLHSHRNNDTGVLYLGNSGGHYLYFDGATFQLTNNVAIAGTLTASGQINASTFNANSNTYYFANNVGIYWTWNGTQLQSSHGILSGGAVFLSGNTGYYLLASAPWIQTGPNINNVGVLANNAQIATAASYNGGANANGYLAPNNNPGGVGLAQAWATYSSLIHADQYGLRVEKVTDPLSVVNAITGYSYDHLNFEGEFESESEKPARLDDGSLDTTPLYGFHPQEVFKVLPELVDLDPKGNPAYLDLDRMLVILWEAVKELDARTQPVA